MMQSSRFLMFHSDDVPGPSADIDHPTSHKQCLLPHGRVWAVRDTLLIDPSAKDNVHSARFRWPEALTMVDVKKEIDYLYQLYPMRGLNQMLAYTNANLHSNGHVLLTRGEYLKYLGLRLAMVCERKRGPITIYWEQGVQPGGTIYTGADFGGRFGMTRHRFQNITQCLSFADPKPAVRVEDVSTTITL